MKKPAHVQGLLADSGPQVIREYQVLHVQVVGGSNGAAGHLVLGQQQRTRLETEIG
jgi:hypothetical protein